MYPPKAFDRLVQAGKLAGSLRISDLGRALPVETMTVDEIADVVARLEGAGIPVEIDAELEAPRHRKTDPTSMVVPEKSSLSNATPTGHARWEALAASIKEKELQNSRHNIKISKKSGTVFVIAAALILILIALIAWSFSGA